VAPPGTSVSIDLRSQTPHERRFPHHFPHHRTTGPTRVELHVMDEGPGMTEEQRRRAFDRFWRAPDAPKGGTGLGLALVQRLAHAGGGEALLRPAPSGGLDAVVHLPCASHRDGVPNRDGTPNRDGPHAPDHRPPRTLEATTR
jgi:signal transduction histidine kinase